MRLKRENINTIIKILAAITIFASFLYIAWANYDPDLGWHLAVGNWTRENNALPQFDVYTHTMPGHGWVNHEWLVDIWLSFMNESGLWFIVVFLFAAMGSAPFLYWLKKSRHFVQYGLIILLAIIMTKFFGVRPQVITFALFFLVFETLRKTYRNSKKGAPDAVPLVTLPLIFFIWANLHAGFFAGLVLWGFWITVHHISAFIKERVVSLKELGSDATLFILSVVATLINPYGIRLYGEIFSVMGSQDTAKLLIEWQPLYSKPMLALPFVLGLVAFWYLKIYKKHEIRVVATALLFFAFFIRSVRMGPIFFITLFPLISAPPLVLNRLDAVQKRFRSFATSKEHMSILEIFIALVLLLSLFQSAMLANSVRIPADATQFLKENGEELYGNLLNTYGWGGYLTLIAPEIPIFIDGRMPHWKGATGNSAMKDYSQIFIGPENAWQDIFQRRNVKTVLLQNYISRPKLFERTALKFLPEKIRAGISNFRLPEVFYNTFAPDNVNDIVEILKNRKWRVAYEDEVAIILTCEKRCW